jgi:hypothetical protein
LPRRRAVVALPSANDGACATDQRREDERPGDEYGALEAGDDREVRDEGRDGDDGPERSGGEPFTRRDPDPCGGAAEERPADGRGEQRRRGDGDREDESERFDPERRRGVRTDDGNGRQGDQHGADSLVHAGRSRVAGKALVP